MSPFIHLSDECALSTFSPAHLLLFTLQLDILFNLLNFIYLCISNVLTKIQFTHLLVSLSFFLPPLFSPTELPYLPRKPRYLHRYFIGPYVTTNCSRLCLIISWNKYFGFFGTWFHRQVSWTEKETSQSLSFFLPSLSTSSSSSLFSSSSPPLTYLSLPLCLSPRLLLLAFKLNSQLDIHWFFFRLLLTVSLLFSYHYWLCNHPLLRQILNWMQLLFLFSFLPSFFFFPLHVRFTCISFSFTSLAPLISCTFKSCNLLQITNYPLSLYLVILFVKSISWIAFINLFFFLSSLSLDLFSYFFYVLAGFIFYGFFYGTLLLPILLSIVGPESELISLEHEDRISTPTPQASPILSCRSISPLHDEYPFIPHHNYHRTASYRSRSHKNKSFESLRSGKVKTLPSQYFSLRHYPPITASDLSLSTIEEESRSNYQSSAEFIVAPPELVVKTTAITNVTSTPNGYHSTRCDEPPVSFTCFLLAFHSIKSSH